MGSAGTGRFTDYPGSRSGEADKGGTQDGGDGSSEGGGGSDRCLDALQAIRLEEVERCAYFQSNADVPPPGTDVELQANLVSGRLAVGILGGEVVGFLPTRFNYLLGCLGSGYRYPGEVTASSGAPLASVEVELTPTP